MSGSSGVSCKFHPGASLIEDYRAGDQICSECGLVVGDRVIDVGSEWRTFSNDAGGEDRSRVGGPENTLLGSSDLSTMIGPGRMAGSSSNMDTMARPCITTGTARSAAPTGPSLTPSGPS